MHFEATTSLQLYFFSSLCLTSLSFNFFCLLIKTHALIPSFLAISLPSSFSYNLSFAYLFRHVSLLFYICLFLFLLFLLILSLSWENEIQNLVQDIFLSLKSFQANFLIRSKTLTCERQKEATTTTTTTATTMTTTTAAVKKRKMASEADVEPTFCVCCRDPAMMVECFTIF